MNCNDSWLFFIHIFRIHKYFEKIIFRKPNLMWKFIALVLYNIYCEKRKLLIVFIEDTK